MNQQLQRISSITNRTTVTLSKNKIYDVYEDDCILLHGYHCSNTATKEENPDGFRKTAIWLEDKENIVIDGNHSTILIHGIMTPIILRNCKNITIKNLNFDYFRPTMSQFTILENKHGSCLLSIHPESLYEIRGNQLIWCGEKQENGTYRWEHSYKSADTLSMYFDPQRKQLRFLDREDGDRFPSVPAFSEIKQIDSNLLSVVLKDKDALFPEGCIIQSRRVIRDQIGGFFDHCTNLTFNNVNVQFFHGLGMLSQICENVTFKNCNFIPKGDRTFVSNADGFQFSGCKGKILIENCRAYGNHDDFVNIHGTHLQVTSMDFNEKSMVVRFKNNCTWGFQAFDPGDIIELIHWDTLTPYYRTKVVLFEKLSDTDIKLYVRKLPDKIELEKDVVANLTQTPSVAIRNNYFGYTAARGILCTTPKKVLIERNVFECNASPALLIEDDCNFWFESGYTKNVIFKDNRVINCGFSDDSDGIVDIAVTPQVMNTDSDKYVHHSLKIVGNTFASSEGQKHVMKFNYIRSARIKNNTFDTPLIIKKHFSNIDCDLRLHRNPAMEM